MFILAYALTILGCGYKTMPYWKNDAPKEQQIEQSTQSTMQESKK